MGKKEQINKRMILTVLETNGNVTISKLAKYLGLSRPVIYHHLDTLEKQGYIKRKKNFKKKGAPVTIYLIKSKIKKQEARELKRLLMFLKKNEGISQDDFFLDFDGDNNSYSIALFSGYINHKICLSSKGEQFLQDNKNLN